MRTDERLALDNFLVANGELEDLSARLNRINILSILGCERAEIRHSNVLAWLLDPSGSHGVGDSLLRELLGKLLVAYPALGQGLTASHAQLMSLGSVEVRREWQHCDVVVLIPDQDDRPGWCLLIENKITARETRGQLARYREAVDGTFGDATVLPVFLTLSGDDPSTAAQKLGWRALAYGEVLDSVERLLARRQDRVPPEAALLITHWIQTLRRLTVTDADLTKLCKDIYRKHRKAIDLIKEYGMVAGVVDACAQWLEEGAAGELAFDPVVRGNRVWFMPARMAAAQHEVSPGWRHLPTSYPVSWWFAHLPKNERLQLGLEVAPIGDGQFRTQLIESLQASGFRTLKKATSEDARYTRIWGKILELPRDSSDQVADDPDEIAKVAAQLWGANGTRETDRFLHALEGFAWQ